MRQPTRTILSVVKVVVAVVSLATAANAQGEPDLPSPTSNPPVFNLAAGPTDWDGDGSGDIAFLLRKLSDGKTYLVIDNKLQQRMNLEKGVGHIEIALKLNNRQSTPAQYKIAAGPLLSPNQTAMLVQHKGSGRYQMITAFEAGPTFDLRQVYKWGYGCRKKRAPWGAKSVMLVAQFGEKKRIVNWVDNYRYVQAEPIRGRIVWNANPGACTGVQDSPGAWPRQQWEPITAGFTGYYDGVDKGATLVRVANDSWQFNTDRDSKTDRSIKFWSRPGIPGDFNNDGVSDVAVYWSEAGRGEFCISQKPVMDVANGVNLWTNSKFRDFRIYAKSGAGTNMSADYDLDGKTELAVLRVDVNAKTIKVKIDFDDDHIFQPDEVYKLSYQGYHPIGEMRWAGNVRVPLPNRAD